MAKNLKEAVEDIQKIQKSLDAKLENTEKSVKQSNDELAAQEEANKHVENANISEDNEKVAKKDEKADKAGNCGDTDEVDESAKKSKEAENYEEPAKKSVKKDDEDQDDDGDDEATGSEEEKSVKKDDDDATGDTDVAEESKKPAKDNVKKDTDGKVEEAKAKQAKELNNVEDVKGHEEASKSLVDAIDVLTKAVNTMVETNKSYNQLLSDVDVLVKSYKPAEEAEKSAVKSCKKDTDSDVDSQPTAKKCGDGEVAESVNKAKKSENTEKCDKPVQKSVEEADDKAEKSMPVGQAVYSEDSDKVEKSVKAEPEENSVSAGEMKDALRKSIIAFAGSELPENMVKVNQMKKLYKSVEAMDDKETVQKSMVDAYNRI